MQSRRAAREAWPKAIIAATILTVFVCDTVTDLEIAAAVFYIVPILMSVRLLNRRHVILLAATCVALTILSSVLTASGSREAGLINLAISTAAIIVTTYLGLRMIASEAAFHEARAQLLRLSRISNLGELVTSIAHEVNQPLAAVTASAGACRRWLDADPPNIAKAQESAERVVDAANLASEVIARVRRLSRRHAPLREPIAINTVITECAALAQGEVERSGTTLLLDLKSNLPVIVGDRVQIQQVVSNLLLNALDALETVDPAIRTIEVSSRLQADGMIAIACADNGSGLGKEARERLWEPFWTSKEGGTGLGLTISQTIVEGHNGQLDYLDTPGGGTTFTVLLPGSNGE